MKKLNFIYTEITITIALIGFLIILSTPVRAILPQMSYVIFFLIAIIWFGIFMKFFLTGKGEDERDEEHLKIASQVSFLIGVAVLMVAVFCQSITNQIDPWLPIILGTIILSKTLSILYRRFTN